MAFEKQFIDAGAVKNVIHLKKYLIIIWKKIMCTLLHILVSALLHMGCLSNISSLSYNIISGWTCTVSLEDMKIRLILITLFLKRFCEGINLKNLLQ